MFQQPAPQSNPSKRTILYVDDDPVDIESVERAIDRRGLPFDFRSAGDLATARRVLEEHAVALLLVDHRLGDGEGIAMLKAAPGIPTIILTGEGSESLAAEALRGGAADYVVKQPDGRHLDGLLGSIMAALARHDAERAQARAAEELARSYRELESLSKALDASVAVPMARIEELAQRLTERPLREDEEARAMAVEIARRAGSGLDVIKRVARLAALNPKAELPRRIDFGDLVRRALRRVTIDWPERVEVMIDSTQAINVRPSQAQSAFECVLEHAAQHGMPDGRPVSIVASCEYDGDWAELRFVDGGVMFDSVDLDSVFSIRGERDATPGTGLAIFERVARIHEGWAWIEDTAEGHLCLCQRVPRTAN